jgi:formylmethanofuran dehydrogenase subunit E
MEQYATAVLAYQVELFKLLEEKKITHAEGMKMLKDKYPAVVSSDDEDEDEELNVDDRDAPNIYPYKKCSDCGERKSTGNYHEDNEGWFCEDCYPKDE